MENFSFKSKSFFIVLLIANIFFTGSAAGQTTYYSRATGGWTTNTTWSLTSGGTAVGAGVFPIAGDIVNIEGGFNVNIPASTSAACATLNVTTANAGNGTLTFNSGSVLTVSGNLTAGISNAAKAAVITMTAGGTLNINGNLSLGSDAASNITQTSPASVTVSGTATIIQSVTTSITNAWNVNSGTATVNGLLTLDGTNTTTTKKSNLVITTGTMNANAGIQINGTTPLTKNITMTGASSILNVGGSGISGAAFSTFIAGSGTSSVNYNAAGNQPNVAAYVYNNLATGGSGTKTLQALTDVNGTLTVSAGTVLNLSSFNITPDAVVMECGAVTGSSVTGTGSFALNGNLTINSLGTGSAAAIISAPVALGSTRTFTIADDGSNAVDLSVTGIMSGSAGLTKAGAGTLELGAVNTYTGTTTLNTGTVLYAISNAIAAGAVTINAGTFDIKGFSDAVGAVTLTDGTIAGTTGVLSSTASFAVENGTITAILGGTAGLTKTTAAGTVTLSGANTYSGITTITSGTLSIGIVANSGSASNIGSGASISIGGSGVLYYTGSGHSTNRPISLTADGPIINGAGTGTLILAGGITGTNTNLTITGISNITETGVIATGSGTFTKTGTNILELDGVNTFTGLTSITGGTIQYGINNALSTGAVTINGGTLDIVSFSDAVGVVTLTSGTISGTTGVLSATSCATASGTISAILGGTGGLSKTTTGTVILSGLNTYTGVTSLTAGVLVVNTISDGGIASSLGAATTAATNLVLGTATLRYTGSTTSSNRNFTINNSTTITIELTTNNLTLSGASTATSGGLTKTGNGTLILSGANLYTGLTSITDRTLRYGIDNALATGGITINSGILDIGTFSDAVGTVTLIDGEINGTTGVLSGSSYAVQDGLITAILGGTGALTKTTTGTVSMSAVNTYTGVTKISAGTLSVATIANGGVACNLGAATNAAANLVLDGGILRYIGITASTDRNYTLTNGKTSIIEITTNTLTLSGASTATSGALTKMGLGILELAGNNLYTGATSVTEGVIRLGAAERIANGSILVIDATFDMNGFNETVGGLIGAGTVTSTSGGNIVLTSGSSSSTAFSGVIENGSATSMALIKIGTGILSLSGSSTYTGPTTITAGTILLEASDVIPDNSIIMNGGTLNTGTNGGFSETLGDLTLAVNSVITLGTGVHSLTIANSAANTWAGTTLTINGWIGTTGAGGGGTAGKIIVGVGGLDATQLGKIKFANYNLGALITASGELVPTDETTFYSQGSGDPGILTNWNSIRGGGGTTPFSFAGNNIFVIQDTHTMTNTATWSVTGINSKLWIESGGILISDFTITLSSATTFQIDNGGTYIHRNTSSYASNIFAGTEIFGPSSNVIINITNTTLPTVSTYGNLTLNFTSDPGGNMNFSGNMTNIQGNFDIQNTQNREVRLVGATPASYTLNIAGNLSVSGSTSILKFTSSTSSPVVNVAGNVSFSGGTINMTDGVNPGTLNITGNFSHTGGTITETSSGRGEIVFVPGTHLYTSGGSLANTINFTNNNGSILQMGTAATPAIIPSGSNGTFTNSGTLGITSSGGITLSGATGNIQVTGLRTYNTVANYIYNGSVLQASGNGLTGADNLEINNAAGITLTVDAFIANSLILTSGNINCGSNTLSVITNYSGAIVRTSGYVIGNLKRAIATGTNTYSYPVGNATDYLPVSLAFNSVSSGGSIAVRTVDGPGGNYPVASLNATKRLIRNWVVTNTGLAGFNVNAAFTFLAADLAGGTTTGTLKAYKADAGPVYTFPALADFSFTGTTYNYNNLTSFGSTAGFSEFGAGECGGVAPITGITGLCIGTTSQLSDVTPNGVWSSDVPAIASINAGGLVTANSPGNATVRYTVSNTNGCAGEVTTVITVNDNSTITLSSAAGTDAQVVCVNNALTTISYTTGGGATSASITAGSLPLGVTGSYNAGIFTISGTPTQPGNFNYTITATGPCLNSSLNGTITVNANSTITLSSAAGTNAQSICINNPVTTILYTISGGGTGASITAGALPAGVTGSYNAGTFTISGTPTVAGNFSYTVTTTGPCLNNSASGTITVNALPSVSFSGLASSYCANAPSVTLTGSPAGGLFSGTGITGNTFNPATAGTGGPYAITYIYTDGNGCSNSSTQMVTVNALPTVSFSGLASSYCIDAPSVTLTGTPVGGVFSGAGITGNTFDPSAAGAGGPYAIIYTYTGGNGCSNSSTQMVTVNALPTVSFSGLSSSYCVNAPSATLTGSPVGGVFSGAGITANTFNPASAGVGGPYAITYSYTDGNGCSNSSTQMVTVNPLPTVSFSGLASSYCANAPSVTLTGSPVGGVFGGAGITGNTFDPSAAGAGSPYTITYTYTDVNGCSNTSTQLVTVNALPAVSFSGLASSYCINAPSATLTGSPVGGVFSGTGMTGNTFDPGSAGVGGPYAITYSYTDGNGCSNSSTQMVTVNALPTVSFSGLASSYCVNAPSVTLTGSPVGGVFSGTSVTGNTFNPTSAGVGGPYAITYTYTDLNGCSNSSTQMVTVIPLPIVSFSGLASSYCVNAPSVTLTGSPAGGAFSGVGITGNTFDPSAAGSGGPYAITYTYTDGNGCSNNSTQMVTVNALPAVSFSGLASSYCINAPSATLTGSPVGGVFSGTGMTGNTFDPGSAGVGGPYAITYSYTDGNGCSNSSTQMVTVNALPTVSFSGLSSSYCANAPSVTLTGSPAGGTFNGTGVTGNTFDPATAGTGGPYAITYTYTDGNGCSNSSTQMVTVNALPTVSFSGLASSYCVNAPSVTLTGSPVGGVFSGAGITGNTFDPAIAGTGGPYAITYTYTDVNGCSNSSTQMVTVNALPTVSFSGLATTYCTTDAPVILTGSPTGGIFSGTGISGNTFDPSAAGPGGPYSITYTFTDGNGCSNSSTQQVSVLVCTTSITVNMKFFLQGYYDGGGLMKPVLINQGIAAQANETDSVVLELHDPGTFSLIDLKKAVLLTDGTVSASFVQPAGSYYIGIRHRNSIQTWTAVPVACSLSTPLYDLTSAASQAFADNMIEVEPGKWALYTGDISQDDYIDGNDFPQYDSESASGGLYDGTYTTTDLNGDGFVDGNDFPVFDSNSSNGVSAIYPQ